MMLRARSTASLRTIASFRSSAFSSCSARPSSHQPNAPLDVDESMQSVFQGLGKMMQEAKAAVHQHNPDLHELTVYPTDADAAEVAPRVEEPDEREERKSPAGSFGSQRIGAVVIPQELQDSISELISTSDKRLIRRDVKRLFNEDGSEGGWDPSFDVHYRTFRQARLHGERDGTAFASIILPAHYSAIYAVLRHIRLRLGPDWSVQNVLDWGAATGSGFWATCHAFQMANSPESNDEIRQSTLSSTAISRYIGMERRDGLVNIGKKLIEGVPHDSLDISWQRKFRADDWLQLHNGGGTIAISAFLLSTLQGSIQRKAVLKEMWESGAETIVLLDHSSPTGFASIIEARELFLNLGRKQADNPGSETKQLAGSHVLAPCPHDGDCPIFAANHSKVVCGFSQRMERPPFVRLTKHSGVGHEDIEYSYVVIRRGLRPKRPEAKVGRVGQVGRRQMQHEESKRPPVELQLDEGDSRPEHTLASAPPETVEDSHILNPDLIDSLLKAEAFHWPRLVFPPLKKSGHVIMDVCAPTGKILRMTVPKSQGKQPYYDARKSHWGDLFPHEPKNRPQVRFAEQQARKERKSPSSDASAAKSKKPASTGDASYPHIAAGVNQRKKELRRERWRSSQKYSKIPEL
ncbi:mitochondrial small ribosomal subunit Rsm22-domain-containing protein [Gloeopeniophorella convolvens]|nr:mitochondrial small ribosomal subunit Rsm22-domain-containing protein [Gloeopeniophorella convolvens]